MPHWSLWTAARCHVFEGVAPARLSQRFLDNRRTWGVLLPTPVGTGGGDYCLSAVVLSPQGGAVDKGGEWGENSGKRVCCGWLLPTWLHLLVLMSSSGCLPLFLRQLNPKTSPVPAHAGLCQTQHTNLLFPWAARRGEQRCSVQKQKRLAAPYVLYFYMDTCSRTFHTAVPLLQLDLGTIQNCPIVVPRGYYSVTCVFGFWKHVFSGRNRFWDLCT